MSRHLAILFAGVLLHALTGEAQIPALPGGPIAVVTNERGAFRFVELQPPNVGAASADAIPRQFMFRVRGDS